ncbi:MAG: glycosyltransferase, partial [Candidatus Omnitrophica bacterium]|nr:glycosyltransferase [Candidatus Omnitrophota bacterium]
MNSLKAKGFYLYEEEEKWIGKGVTYGPFQPNERGEPFPSVSQIHHDFESIAAMGANVLRVYTVPNRDFAEMAGEYGLRLLVDIPWPKHLDAYDNHAVRDMCLEMVRTEVQKVKDFTNLAGLILGNEIPSDLVRWAGPKKVENLLRDLLREARSELPDTLIGYANFPGTEFLQPTFFDFVAFNVYLYDSPKFESYLVRLRQMYPHSPLILTEIGYHADSENEEDQAQFLGESLAVAYRVGLAGAFVFSWTDEWHTGGYDITDWSFGLVDVERETKKSFHTVSDVFQSAPQCDELPHIPKVSVVVATYNGGKTLGQCLESLETVDYPNFEVIVVDDGSTDDTASILKEHPSIRAISQPNKGLSEARNAGIQASTGEIVAFIDSDCYADPDWLYHIVRQFQLGDFTGVGGPNLTPEEPRLVHQSIALAPGHATHVLFENGDAEHVPGCNMAFLREALIDADGFDPIFRKAGDDVDIAWRLQDLGHRLSFSTAGFVWHHRRSTLRAYIKQQIGYGEAEALLRNKHPQRFNDRGQSIWGGRIYQGLGDTTPLGKPNIQYGIFGSAGYQCIYPPGGSWVYYLMSSIEWWAISLALIVTGLFSLPAMCLGVAGIG